MNLKDEKKIKIILNDDLSETSQIGLEDEEEEELLETDILDEDTLNS